MIKKILLSIISLMLLAGVIIVVIEFMPGTDTIDPLTYFDEFKQGQLNMVYEDVRVEWDEPVVEKEGILYVDINWAEQYVDDRLFYDEPEQSVTITNIQEVVRLDLVTEAISVNNKPSDRTLPIIQEGGKVYIAETYLEAEYDFDIAVGVDERIVVASDMSTSKQIATVKSRDAQLRTLPHHKGLIVEEVPKDHELIIYGETDNGYLRVRSENGIIGFVAEKQLAKQGETVIKENKVYEAKPLKYPLDEKVNLIWDQMTVRTAGNWDSAKYANIGSANVISPTWFEFADGEGNLIDRGHPDYVAQAKARGLQVWALMSHNFTEKQYTKEVLTSTAKRQHVIDQLVDASLRYGLEGINIDIENVQKEFSREWVQFMRELYPQLQEIGVTVSVDVYMPSAWSTFYERGKISEVVDYFIVMAYDQHWGGAEEAGPTAGLTWVEEGIQLNLEEVPSEKLVLGLPFFTRIWEESSEGLKSSAYSMPAAANSVTKWGVTPVLDEVEQVPYAAYTENGTTYKVWLEDTNTMSKRIDMINDYGLAGYAGWKLGLEDSAIWPLLETVK